MYEQVILIPNKENAMTKFLNMFRDSDFVTGLLLFAIATISYSGTGDNMKDWIFPLMASYTLFFISIAFLLKSVFKVLNGKLIVDLTLTREQLPSAINVGFFCFFVLCYLFVLFAVGFWIASPLLLWVSIAYFNPDKSARSFFKSLLISLIACGVAYVVFTHIFYVPFPQSRLFG